MFFLMVFFLSFPGWSADSLYLELSSKGAQWDIGLSPLVLDKGLPESQQAPEILATLKSDLEFTRRFTLVEGGPLCQGAKQTSEWNRLGADVVAGGRVEKPLFGRPQFLGILYDAGTGKTVLEKTWPLEKGPRRVAHLWADEIVRYFTGQPGIASTQIVFVNDTTGKKEIYSCDADGAGVQRLTGDRSIALFPKLSPDGLWVVFTTFRSGRPEVALVGSDGQNIRSLCRFDGLNSAAAWMPDGKSLVATVSQGGVPNLCLINLDGQIIQKITDSAAADTAPTVSPDGLKIAFTSDRPGFPQIYVTGSNGTDVRRLTKGAISDSPDWSPLGHLLVFTTQENNFFDLWTLEPTTGKTTRLTFGEGDNENASWSPDGRHLVFTSTRRGKPELWVMDADGSNPHPLGNIPGRSFTPHWGGF